MPNSSILGGERPDQRAAGRDADALGPSDSSDSGSDIQGASPMPTDPDNPGELGAVPVDGGADSDREGTGERASATGDVREDADILPDRVADDPTLVDRDFRDTVEADELIDPDDLAAGEDDGDEADEADPDAIESSRPL